MAKVIEFYTPRRFRNPFVRAAQPHPGKVIEFCSATKTSVPARPRPRGGALAWLLEAAEPNRALGSE